MEHLSKILDAISAEGKAAADKIIDDGAKNAEEVHRLYEKEADIDKAEILKKAEKKAEEVHQRSLSQAGIESRNIKLSAKREAMKQVFAMAGEKLASSSQEDKKTLYEKLIRKFSGGEEVNVQLNEADSKAFGKKLKARGIRIELDKTPGDFSGGLIIKEGYMETNCTFEVLIEDAKTTMETEIAAMLFS